jgi:carbon storage regulator CsrA
MLVLSRKSQESVVVGGHNPRECMLKVTVLEIGRGKVRLGFEVKDDVPVHRWEVWQRICAGAQPSPLSGEAAPHVMVTQEERDGRSGASHSSRWLKFPGHLAAERRHVQAIEPGARLRKCRSCGKPIRDGDPSSCGARYDSMRRLLVLKAIRPEDYHRSCSVLAGEPAGHTKEHK